MREKFLAVLKQLCIYLCIKKPDDTNEPKVELGQAVISSFFYVEFDVYTGAGCQHSVAYQN